MKRYIIAGAFFFLVFAVAFAPAGLIVRGLAKVDGVDLVDARGTLWRGTGTLLVANTDQGDVIWRFRPLSILQFSPTYEWSLANNNVQLNGAAAYLGDSASLDLQGSLPADLFNPWLRRYDIYLSGNIQISPTNLTLENLSQPTLTQASGQIKWSGGPVRYKQSGILREAQLPPLVANVQQTAVGVQAIVYEEGNETPLLVGEQSKSGYVKVGMTKRFTKLLKNTWPGSDPDHEIVLEFEEQIF